MTIDTPKKEFSVISFDDESGQSFLDHVVARSGQHAMFLVAGERTCANIVAALPGHLQEGESIDFAGESVVDAETILSQPDVFDVE